MSINPFLEKAPKLDKCYEDWKRLYQKPYDKMAIDPYSKVRIILAQGAEYEAVWFGHQFSRHCDNNDLRRELAAVRRSEQQQQKKLASLKPKDENLLEVTIGYEQLAVDLTVNLALLESDKYVRSALDFALLEDFDHLYRFSDLLEMEQGVKGEMLVGGYTEIMPGRPTIAEHRYPYDDIRRHINSDKATLATKLNTMIITAAEQQTMNYYMNQGAFYTSDIGRKLFTEIAMIEEQHVSQYGSLIDTNCTRLQCLLMHEYTECYLYYSLMNDETDDNVRKVFEQCFTQELSHLHKARTLLNTYEGSDYEAVVGEGTFPELLAFDKYAERNKEYVRNVLAKTVRNTAILEDYTKVSELPGDYEFFKYNSHVNKAPQYVASHNVIESYIGEFGEDYRFETAPHPIKELRSRKVDNTDIGRTTNQQ